MTNDTFDPDVFLDTENNEANVTNFDPIPAGEYPATIEKIGVKKIDRDEDDLIILQVSYLIHDADLAKELDMEKVTVNQSIFLDVDENGSISMGKNKNVILGRLRAALGQNEVGKPWSFNHLRGAGPLMVTIKNKPDREDPTIIYSQVAKTSIAV